MTSLKAHPIYSILVGLSIFTVLVYIASEMILMQSFATIEKEFASENVKRIISAINNDLDQLKTIAGDYAGWDDAYTFVQDGNSEFITANLDDAMFAKLRLNLMGYVKNSGATVYVKMFDAKTGKKALVPHSLLRYIKPDSPLVRHETTESVLSGILMLPEGPLMLVSRPVLTSAYAGPIHGAIIMGRFLNTAEVQRFGEITHQPFVLDPFVDTPQPAEISAVSSAFAGTTPTTVTVQQQSSQTMSGYGLIRDIFGKPALIARVDMKRKIYNQGVRTANYFIGWIFGVGLIFVYIGLGMYKKMILSRHECNQTKERYRSVIRQATDSILLIEIESQHILEANAAFEQLLGYAPEEIRGLTLYNIMTENRAGVDWHVRRVLEENCHQLGEWIFRKKTVMAWPSS